MSITIAHAGRVIDGDYVGRPARGRRGSPLGNPFKMTNDSDAERERVVSAYEARLRGSLAVGDHDVTQAIDALVDKYRVTGSLVLTCWCTKAVPCRRDCRCG